jgi:hypothetical protein
MSNLTINQFPLDSGGFDGANDLLLMWKNSDSTTRNVTRNILLNVSGQPADISTAQTFTNKTLTSPIITAPTVTGTISGTYTLGGTPTFPSTVVLTTGTQSLSGKTLTSATLTSPTVTSGISVAGGVSSDTLTTTGSASVGTTLGVTGATTLSSTLGVTGNSTLTGSLTVGSTLGVSGITTFNNSVGISPQTATSVATLTPNLSSNTVILTAQAVALTVAAPTGSPVDGESLLIRIKDNGTSQGIAWNGVYNPVQVTLPTSTTVGKTQYVGMKWNSVTNAWDILSVAVG